MIETEPISPMRMTTRFKNRQNRLGQALAKRSLETLWRKNVRDSMRKQIPSDLHDYYDFQIHRKSRIQALRDQVLSGEYAPGAPTRVRAERETEFQDRSCY